MKRYLLTATLITSLTACSTLTSPRVEKLGHIQAVLIKLKSNDVIDVSHEQVQERYQRYLEVSTDTEMRIRTTHRMAALKLQARSEEHTSELQSRPHLVCRLLLEKKKKITMY